MYHGYEKLAMKNKWKMAGKVWKIPIFELRFVYLHEDIGKREGIYTPEKKSKTFWKKKSWDIDLTANVGFRSMHALRDGLLHSTIEDEYIF